MNAPTYPAFSGVLFFPVTPFTETGAVDLDELARHIASGVDAGPGGVFIACGTGEFHALDPAGVRPCRSHRRRRGRGSRTRLRRRRWLGRAGQAVRQGRKGCGRRRTAAASAVPRRGAAGRPRRLRQGSRRAPPTCPSSSTTATTPASPTPRRSRCRRFDNVIGFKDGTGDLDNVGRIVRAVTDSLAGDKEFLFFNGMPTAETTQHAYRAIGVPLYSSATFAFAPDLALAFYNALEPETMHWPTRFCGSSSTRWSDSATPCPATPSRSSRQASRSRAYPPGRCVHRLSCRAPTTSRSCSSIIAAGRAVLADALTEAR